MDEVSGSASTSTYRVPFVPRSYPVLKLIIAALYLLAALAFADAVLWAIALGPVLLLAAVLLVHAVAVVLLAAVAEMIRVVLDIQENNHESAHYLKLGHFKR